jgi:hypothetical protein
MPLVRLGEIALARSGDKGSSANIGVVARTDAGYGFLRDNLTADKVEKFFAAMSPAKVTRYELSNISSLNFVLTGILGSAGGSDSLRIDAQGKALGQALLEMQIQVPDELLGALRGG